MRGTHARATLIGMPVTHDFRFRHATPADLPGLVALEQATFSSDCIPRAQWRRYLRNPGTSVLVHGRPDAPDAAAVVFYRRNSRHARLYSLAVAAATRGSGLGGALLAAAEADAVRHGCDAMHLEVRVDNTPAIALYEHHGFVRGARVAAFYEDGTDAFRYAKPFAAR